MKNEEPKQRDELMSVRSFRQNFCLDRIYQEDIQNTRTQQSSAPQEEGPKIGKEHSSLKENDYKVVT